MNEDSPRTASTERSGQSDNHPENLQLQIAHPTPPLHPAPARHKQQRPTHLQNPITNIASASIQPNGSPAAGGGAATPATAGTDSAQGSHTRNPQLQPRFTRLEIRPNSPAPIPHRQRQPRSIRPTRPTATSSANTFAGIERIAIHHFKIPTKAHGSAVGPSPRRSRGLCRLPLTKPSSETPLPREISSPQSLLPHLAV